MKGDSLQVFNMINNNTRYIKGILFLIISLSISDAIIILLITVCYHIHINLQIKIYQRYVSTFLDLKKLRFNKIMLSFLYYTQIHRELNVICIRFHQFNCIGNSIHAFITTYLIKNI